MQPAQFLRVLIIILFRRWFLCLFAVPGLSLEGFHTASSHADLVLPAASSILVPAGCDDWDREFITAAIRPTGLQMAHGTRQYAYGIAIDAPNGVFLLASSSLR